MASSSKTIDFLSELKATLSKLAARDDEPDTAKNVIECAGQMTADHHHHHHHSNQYLESDRETTAVNRRRVDLLYGELNSALERRGQQQQQQQLNDVSRVVDLESRLKPGKSIVYLGGRQRRDDDLSTEAITVTQCSHEPPVSDVTVTPCLSENVETTRSTMTGGDVEVNDADNNSTVDVISTSSPVASITQICMSSNHGNQDSACFMSADESAESSDSSLLTTQRVKSVVKRHNEHQLTASSNDEEQRRHHAQHFATFPLIRRTPTSNDQPAPADDCHDDVITTLMITHSGEPISVGLNHQDHHVVDRPLSVPVTVPEPTSFHQDGSQIRQQLLEHRRSASAQRGSEHGKSTRVQEDERRCHRTRRCRRLEQTDCKTTDSDNTSQPTTGRNWRLSPSPVFHLLPHHHQASYCVNSLHSVVDSFIDTDSQAFCPVSPSSHNRYISFNLSHIYSHFHGNFVYVFLRCLYAMGNHIA